MMHPSYLIDWDKQKTYRYSKKDSLTYVTEKELKKDSSEIFFRNIQNKNPFTFSLEDTSTISIANKKCHRGILRTQKNDDLIFFYSKDPSKVRSPLNGFLPESFPYNVMRAIFSTDWTKADGKLAQGTMIFQVSEIKECSLPDSLFQIPK